LLVFVALNLGSAVSLRAERVSKATNELSVAQSVLRTALEQAYPRLAQGGDVVGAVEFTGRPNALDFVAPLPPGAAVGGYHRLRISLDRAGDDGTLVLSWMVSGESGSASETTSPIGRTELLSGVRSAKFSYFGGTEDSGRQGWHGEWVDRLELPRLIRLDVEFGGDGRYWPPLSVRPRIDVDASCVLDLLSRTCRGR
jgi:general secretion pathway protein J